jgi:hypothetical protein
MKLRIKDNAIRIRLGKSEVARLAAGAVVCQTTTFAPQQHLTCSIEPSDVTDLAVVFSGSEIVLRVPQPKIHRWAMSDAVEISSIQTVEGSATLVILLEKDFECLHADHAPEPDAYPHPQGAARVSA